MLIKEKREVQNSSYGNSLACLKIDNLNEHPVNIVLNHLVSHSSIEYGVEIHSFVFDKNRVYKTIVFEDLGLSSFVKEILTRKEIYISCSLLVDIKEVLGLCIPKFYAFSSEKELSNINENIQNLEEDYIFGNTNEILRYVDFKFSNLFQNIGWHYFDSLKIKIDKKENFWLMSIPEKQSLFINIYETEKGYARNCPCFRRFDHFFNEVMKLSCNDFNKELSNFNGFYYNIKNERRPEIKNRTSFGRFSHILGSY